LRCSDLTARGFEMFTWDSTARGFLRCSLGLVQPVEGRHGGQGEEWRKERKRTVGERSRFGRGKVSHRFDCQDQGTSPIENLGRGTVPDGWTSCALV
jgi:hypothetical protein